MKPAVSVIVPAHNAEHTVAETVCSLLALDYPKECLEIVVVDNASTDGTAAVLARYADRIRVVRETRRGRSQARNAGLRATRFPVVAFIDADCTAAPDWLAYIVPRLEDPSVGVAGGKILGKRPCNAVEEFGEWVHDHARSINTLRPPYAVTPNWASRRRVLMEVGAFDEKLWRGGDCDLSYRILQAGYKLVYEDRALVFHRNHSNLRGLFREGFDHGFHSVPLIRKHRAFLRDFGHRPIRLKRYKKLAANVAKTLSGEADARTRLETIFEAGKRAGKICGSIRFGWIDL